MLLDDLRACGLAPAETTYADMADRCQVAEVGYAKLSIEGIAAAAGVGKQTIYRWWPSKGAVLLDSLLALSEGQDSEVAALPDTGDIEADLKLVGLRAPLEH